jgi:hypothetical protein
MSMVAPVVCRERVVDQVLVETGTGPVDDPYFDLLPESTNLSEVDYRAFINLKPQTVVANAAGTFGSRNIHSAVYDAQRLCRPI